MHKTTETDAQWKKLAFLMIFFYFSGASSSVVLCIVAQPEYRKELLRSKKRQTFTIPLDLSAVCLFWASEKCFHQTYFVVDQKMALGLSGCWRREGGKTLSKGLFYI